MMNLSAAIFTCIVAILTKGSIPKWNTILLWFLVSVNIGLFALNNI